MVRPLFPFARFQFQGVVVEFVVESLCWASTVSVDDGVVSIFVVGCGVSISI